MARPPLATITDLERAVGPVASDDETRATYLLEQASARVRAYAGQDWLNEAGTAVEGVPEDVPNVVVGMVERATRNPDGIVSEAAGPYRRSFGPDAATRLYLDQWDRLVIRRAAGLSSIGVVTTTRGPIETTPLTDPFDPYPTETRESLDGLL